jgi:hypothetical protein
LTIPKNNVTRKILFCKGTILNYTGQKNNLTRIISFYTGTIFNLTRQKNNLIRQIYFWKGIIFNLTRQKNNLTRQISFYEGNFSQQNCSKAQWRMKISTLCKIEVSALYYIFTITFINKKYKLSL